MRLSSPCLALLLINACALTPSISAQTTAPPAPSTVAVTPVEQLAATLIAAKEEEREALLNQQAALVTIELVRSLNKQNRRLIDKGEYARGLANGVFVRQLAERLQDQAGVAQSIYTSGVALTLQGEYKQALAMYRQSLALREAVGNKQEIAASLNALGFVSDQMGDYTQALEYHQKSLALREALGDPSLLSASYNNIGIVYDSLGEYDAALDYYGRSLVLRESAKDVLGMAQTLSNLGVVHSKRGDYRQAVESYRRALALLDTQDDKRLRAQALYDLGLTLKTQGDYEQAIEYYRRNLALKEELGNRAGIAMTLSSLGEIYGLQDNYQQALDNYRQALKINEEVGVRLGVATTLGRIARIEDKQGHTERALELYRQSLALSEELKEKNRLTGTLNQLADFTLRQGQFAPALEYAKRAAAISREAGHRESLWQALTTMGNAYRALNQPAQARESFIEAITVIEDLRSRVAGGELEQERFFEDKLAPYHALMEMLTSEGRKGEALALAERAKARVLLDVLQTGRVNITKAMTAAEQEQERKLNSQLVSLNGQIEKEQARTQPDAASLTDLQNRQRSARLAYESFQTNLYAAHPDLKTQRGQTPPFTQDDAAALLDNQTALLEFVLTDENAYLFVLTRDGSEKSGLGRQQPPSATKNNAAPRLAVYTLPVKSQDLTAQATNFRRLLAERNLDFQTPARKLYELLLKPAEKQLAGKTTLCIVPDGALWELPFQALQPTDDSYLWDAYAIFYAPSLSVLRRMREQRQHRAPSLLAFGNPALSDETLARGPVTERDETPGALPEAEKEVNTLAELYGPTRSRVFTRAEAREATFKREAERFNILHFATHATLDDRAPMYSRIVLAKGDNDANEDGRLEAWELVKLNLHADLVTLSACQTARGRIASGEGMIGMSWAFFVAGSPSLLVSQWRVNAASTTDLMIAFNRRFAPSATPKGPPTKTAALRDAAQALRQDKRYRHPFYWAGFVLIGDGM